MISFTGSVATGSAIQAGGGQARQARRRSSSAARAPFIVFPDADLDAAVGRGHDGAVWGASGQVCTCGHARAACTETIHDEVVERIVGGTRDMQIGSGLRPDDADGPGGLGRSSSSGSSATSRSASEEGAELVLGGERQAATRVLPRADRLHRRAQRHAHRPGGDLRAGDVGIMPFSTEEEAYRIANDIELRARRRRVDERPRAARTAPAAGAARPGRCGSTRTRWSTRGAVRRRQALGPRQRARRRVDRGDDPDQERVDEGRVAERRTPLALAARPSRRAVVVNADKAVPT